MRRPNTPTCRRASPRGRVTGPAAGGGVRLDGALLPVPRQRPARASADHDVLHAAGPVTQLRVD